MRKCKSLISCLLIAAILCTYFPSHIHAHTNDKLVSDSVPSGLKSGRITNPRYADEFDLPAISAPDRTISSYSISSSEIRATLEEAAEELRNGMIQREAEISVTYPANAGFDADAIWQEALSHTGEPVAGDYLAWQWSALTWHTYYDSLSGVYYYTVVYCPEYFTTAAQEAEMDSAVAALLNELNLWSASDYDKVKGTYDWMCGNITYDNANLDNSAYLLKHSAYAALINRTAVCQGYALLFYRLCLELGVDARYISGTGNGGSHGWNIVKLDGLYYNVDATWDATWHQAGAAYNWFLRGSSNFTDHVEGEDYSTPEFKQEYPISPTDHGANVSWPVTGTCGDHLTWHLSEEGTLTISGSGAMYDYYSYEEYPTWNDYVWNIKSVVIGKDVETVGAYAFYYSTALENVTFEGETEIGESAFYYCPALKQVSMPNVTVIGDGCFFDCESLMSVAIGPNVHSIGIQAFYGCKSLSAITVDSGNPYFCVSGNVLFSKDMTRLVTAATDIGTSFTVPSTVKELDPYAFTNCTTLKQITICEGITALKEGVFYGCAALETVNLPASLIQIGDYAFTGCKHLSAISLPNGLQQIGYRAFENCSNLKSVTFPASVTFVGELAFRNCERLSSVYFPGEAPDIADDAFSGVSCVAYYPDPACYKTWTFDKLSDYGGYIVWSVYYQHEYTSTDKGPTCTEEGYTTYICGHCGYSYQDNYVAATGHKWDTGVVIVEPTESTPGQCKYTCLTCGETKVENISTLPHTHTYEKVITAPTCTADGYTTYTCPACGDTYVSDYVSALGHSWDNGVVTVEPTEQTPGERKFTCARCSETKIEEIPVLEHTHQYDSVVTAPTCTEQGYTTHTCHCGYSIKDTFVPATGHSYGEWYESKAATCTENGEQRRDCAACSSYEFATISAKGHDYGDWITTKEPTCTQGGEMRRTCQVCEQYEVTSLNALGHSFTSYISDGNATCTQDGTKTANCDHGCGATDTVEESGSKKGHQFGEWYTVKPATTEEEGLERHDCERCEHYEDRVIPIIAGPDQITSDIYVIGKETVGKIPVGTTIADFLENIGEAEYVWFFKNGKEVPADAVVSTGMEVHLIVGDKLISKLTLVVTGDTNGDGNISITDMLAVKSHVLMKNKLEGAFLLAGDTNGDGSISITDFIQIKSHILGKSTVTPHSIHPQQQKLIRSNQNSFIYCDRS